MFDISNININGEINYKIYNNQFMENIVKEYYILVNIIKNNEFNKLSHNNKEYIVKELIKKNKAKILSELIRLLNSSVNFINTKYFRDLYKFNEVYRNMLKNNI